MLTQPASSGVKKCKRSVIIILDLKKAEESRLFVMKLIVRTVKNRHYATDYAPVAPRKKELYI